MPICGVKRVRYFLLLFLYRQVKNVSITLLLFILFFWSIIVLGFFCCKHFILDCGSKVFDWCNFWFHRVPHSIKNWKDWIDGFFFKLLLSILNLDHCMFMEGFWLAFLANIVIITDWALISHANDWLSKALITDNAIVNYFIFCWAFIFNFPLFLKFIITILL